MKNKPINFTPPQAPKQEFVHRKFKDSRSDPYYWLKEKGKSKVLRYLKSENKYAEKNLQPLKSLKTAMFKEMKSRLPKKEDQEPVSIGEYFYYRTQEKQKPYPIHKRKKKTSGKEEILLDENAVKTKTGYVDIHNVCVSPDHKILAYALDEQGREFYNIYFKNLKTGRVFKKTYFKSHF